MVLDHPPRLEREFGCDDITEIGVRTSDTGDGRTTLAEGIRTGYCASVNLLTKNPGLG
jgi:hypothetical protein